MIKILKNIIALSMFKLLKVLVFFQKNIIIIIDRGKNKLLPMPIILLYTFFAALLLLQANHYPIQPNL